jgi:hypothetical protein
MVFEIWKNKNVKLELADHFCLYGVILDSNDNFLTIKLHNGSFRTISLLQVVQIREDTKFNQGHGGYHG